MFPWARFDRIGETHVVNRPPGVGVNIESHLCDVLPITQELREEGRTAVLLVVDNGADFNPRYITGMNIKLSVKQMIRPKLSP